MEKMRDNCGIVKEYGYEYDAVLNESVWEKTAGKSTDSLFWGAYCLRSGRDALKAIAREFSPRIALVPALACDSMVFPFAMYGHKVSYYRINSDYSIDLNSIEDAKGPAFFLYMDYFGHKAVCDADLELLKSKGYILIEDRTHTLIWERASSFKPDYIAASLRKWLPVPDGGLLWGKISKPFNSDTSFSRIRLQAQCMRHNYLLCGDERIKAEYRKIFSEVSEIMDKDEPSAMSAYSYALANSADWDEIRSVRKRNAEALTAIFQTSPYITLIQKRAGFSDLYVAFTVKNRDVIQRRLSEEGIFNTIIWPLNNVQKKTCSISDFTERNMLAAPCDQRYTVDDMNYIGKEIVRIVEKANE